MIRLGCVTIFSKVAFNYVADASRFFVMHCPAHASSQAKKHKAAAWHTYVISTKFQEELERLFSFWFYKHGL